MSEDNQHINYTVADIHEYLSGKMLPEKMHALEKAALEDKYFIERKLYPNVDFYSGLIYKAMGFPTDMFPVLFGKYFIYISNTYSDSNLTFLFNM